MSVVLPRPKATATAELPAHGSLYLSQPPCPPLIDRAPMMYACTLPPVTPPRAFIHRLHLPRASPPKRFLRACHHLSTRKREYHLRVHSLVHCRQRLCEATSSLTRHLLRRSALIDSTGPRLIPPTIVIVEHPRAANHFPTEPSASEPLLRHVCRPSRERTSPLRFTREHNLTSAAAPSRPPPHRVQLPPEFHLPNTHRLL